MRGNNEIITILGLAIGLCGLVVTLIASIIASVTTLISTLYITYNNSKEQKKERSSQFNKELFQNIEEKVEEALIKIDKFSVLFAKIHNCNMMDHLSIDPNENILTLNSKLADHYFELRYIYTILELYFRGQTSVELFMKSITDYQAYVAEVMIGRNPIVLTAVEKARLSELFNIHLNSAEQLIREIRANLLMERNKFYNEIV